MFKLNRWKVPFLIAIAVLGWVVIFPSQLREIAGFYSEYRVKQAEDKRHADAMAPSPPEIVIESICDERLEQFSTAKAFAGRACTEMGCPAESPCCNSCWITGWKIEGSNYVLSSKLEPLGKCSVDGCGAIRNCQTYFIVGELQKICSN